MKKVFYHLFIISFITQPLFAQWSELGGLNGLAANNRIRTVCSDASNNIYAAGAFTNSSGNYFVAKWDGNTWSELGGLNGLAANNIIFSICGDAMGNIYTAGWFTNSSGKCYVAKWDGSTWSELGGLNGLAANDYISSVCSDASGNIYAAGRFTNGNPLPIGSCYVAQWNGSTWSELGGLNGLAVKNDIESICSDTTGNIYAAGGFLQTGNNNRYVAKWDGNGWSELGGLNALTANSTISSVCSDASGDIYAAGWFSNSSGNDYVAKWDGSTWSELGGLNGLAANSGIFSVCSDGSGNIYAAGGFTNGNPWPNGNRYVAKWDGNSWNELGGLNGLAANSWIAAVCSDTSANVYAAGNFTNSSGNYFVAKYATGTGIENVFSDNELHLFPNPSANEISIQLKNSKIKSITLFDVTGKKVLCKNGLNKNVITLNVSNLEAGIYFVKLFDGEKMFNRKIIVE